MLLVDDTVLVEQYHYGKKAGASEYTLGKDMALFEYYDLEGQRKRNRMAQDGDEDGNRPFLTPFSGLYGDSSRRDSFTLLESHFEFVFRQGGTTLKDYVGTRAV